MAERPIWYEPHPVSVERKAELCAQGYRIVDAIYAPHSVIVAAPPAGTDAEGEALRVMRGPGGRWFVKRGKEIVTGPFATEDEAMAAIERGTPAC